MDCTVREMPVSPRLKTWRMQTESRGTRSRPICSRRAKTGDTSIRGNDSKMFARVRLSFSILAGPMLRRNPDHALTPVSFGAALRFRIHRPAKLQSSRPKSSREIQNVPLPTGSVVSGSGGLVRIAVVLPKSVPGRVWARGEVEAGQRETSVIGSQENRPCPFADACRKITTGVDIERIRDANAIG